MTMGTYGCYYCYQALYFVRPGEDEQIGGYSRKWRLWLIIKPYCSHSTTLTSNILGCISSHSAMDECFLVPVPYSFLLAVERDLVQSSIFNKVKSYLIFSVIGIRAVFRYRNVPIARNERTRG